MVQGFVVILPVVLLMITGGALRRVGFLSEHDVDCLSKLVYWMISPVMLFQTALHMHLDWAANWSLARGIWLAALLSSGVAWLLGKYLLKSPKDILPISVYCAFRSNSMMVGVPVVLLAMGDRAMSAIAIYFAVTEVVYNFMTILLAELVMAHGGGVARTLRKAFAGVVRNPFVIASALGLCGAMLGLHALPGPVEKSLSAIGNMAIGAASLMIGASLKLSKLHSNVRQTCSDLAVRFAIFPAFVFLLLSLFSVDQTVKQVAVLLSAASGGNITFVLAKEYGLNYDYAANFVALTTLMFVVAMPIWLYLLGLV